MPSTTSSSHHLRGRADPDHAPSNAADTRHSRSARSGSRAQALTLIDHNPDLLGRIVETAPARFRELITDAIAQVTDTHACSLARLAVAVRLLVPE